MVKIEEFLEPGETVIKDGWGSYNWEEGKLYLTNKHLFFGLCCVRSTSGVLILGVASRHMGYAKSCH